MPFVCAEGHKGMRQSMRCSAFETACLTIRWQPCKYWGCFCCFPASCSAAWKSTGHSYDSVPEGRCPRLLSQLKTCAGSTKSCSQYICLPGSLGTTIDHESIQSPFCLSSETSWCLVLWAWLARQCGKSGIVPIPSSPCIICIYYLLQALRRKQEAWRRTAYYTLGAVAAAAACYVAYRAFQSLKASDVKVIESAQPQSSSISEVATVE